MNITALGITTSDIMACKREKIVVKKELVSLKIAA